MICMCESEILLQQLYLYTRRVYPGISYDEASLRAVIQHQGLTRMRQLFALSPQARKSLADDVLARMSMTTSGADKAA